MLSFQWIYISLTLCNAAGKMLSSRNEYAFYGNYNIRWCMCIRSTHKDCNSLKKNGRMAIKVGI